MTHTDVDKKIAEIEAEIELAHTGWLWPAGKIVKTIEWLIAQLRAAEAKSQERLEALEEAQMLCLEYHGE